MNKDQVYELFERMISEAVDELMSFTLGSGLTIEHKADKSAVTQCDKSIDLRLSRIAKENGFQVVSEEGDLVQSVAKSGSYMTIDPIDGTLGYIEYVNDALSKGGIKNFLQEDLGPQSDFCLLLGIVEDSVPVFGACYNFITKEKILIDGSNKNNTKRENNKREGLAQNVVYVDQRPGGEIEEELVSIGDATVIKQAALGLKSLYTIINDSKDAVTVHQVQTAGLWDIMPAAVAARAFGGQIYDGLGELLEYNQYLVLPGKGATILKGSKFDFVIERLKEKAKTK